MSEFCVPTPEDLKGPFIVNSGDERRTHQKNTVASGEIVIQAVVTVEAVNPDEKRVKLKGPGGQYITLPVEDDSFLEDLKIREMGVVTYIEALTLSKEYAE